LVRSFTLPDLSVQNQIDAAHKDGMLTVDIAEKQEVEMVSRQIGRK
jgi:HSP20 family molecular chaperone IbpA